MYPCTYRYASLILLPISVQTTANRSNMQDTFNSSASLEAQYSQASKRSHVDNNTVLTSIMDRTPSMRAHFLQMEKYLKTHPSPSGEETGVRLRDQLIVSNYRLAISVASRYRGNGIDMEDLIGFAYIGLTLAADHYDPTQGINFAPYACRWIRKEICRALSEYGHSVRIPDYAARLLKRINRAQQDFYATHGYEASALELADILHVDESLITTLMLSTERFQSLDKSLSDGSEATKADTIKGDMIAPDAILHSADERAQIDAILDNLRPNQREVLVRHYFNGEDFNTIALHMGITPTRARQIHRQVCPRGLS